MPWAKLDDRFWADPDILRVGNEATGAFARMLSFCARNLTDGHVPADIEAFISCRKEVTKALLDEGLIEENGDGGYYVPRYLQFNPSSKDLAKLSRKRRKAGLASAKARAQQDGNKQGDT